MFALQHGYGGAGLPPFPCISQQQGMLLALCPEPSLLLSKEPDAMGQHKPCDTFHV